MIREMAEKLSQELGSETHLLADSRVGGVERDSVTIIKRCNFL